MMTTYGSAFRQAALPGLCLLMALSTVSCNKSAQQTSSESSNATAVKRYHLQGKVVSVDKQAGSANVDAEEIPGFMDAMTMPYPVQPVSALDQLSPGDTITADVVVQGDKYWLENVKVAQHSSTPPAKPAAALQIPAPDEPVPWFQAHQPERRAHFSGAVSRQGAACHFHLHALPFPDYCPRVSGEFAQISRQLHAHAALYRQTHLWHCASSIAIVIGVAIRPDA